MIHLSKSKYCSAVQCPKMLWLQKNMPEAFDDSVVNQAVLDRGNVVGDLAMGLLGDYVEVPYGNQSEMIRQTQELINAGTLVIAEASFAWEGLFCSVDILKILGEGHVEFLEVKSSTHVTDIYVHDVSYQYYVLTQLGYIVDRAFIAHIDSSYVRCGEMELDKLFRLVDLTEAVREKQTEVAQRVHDLTEYMRQTEEPECSIGSQCL